MPTPSLLDKIRRDARLPAPELAAKILRNGLALATAPLYLRACTSVGTFARTVGRPIVRNRGRIEIGDACAILSGFAPVELRAGPGGMLSIGRGAAINFGTLLSAERAVTVGSGVLIGPWSILSDSDGTGEPRPIVVGDDSWLASRVTVLPGARIGRGAVIGAGSVVSGVIPDGVVAAGIPARPLRSADAPRARAGAGPQAPAPGPATRVLLAGDRELEALARALREDPAPPAIDAQILAPDGRVSSEIVLSWTSPTAALPSFAGASRLELVPDAALLRDVDAFAHALRQRFAGAAAVLAPTWTAPWERALLDARRSGLARALALANLRLMDALQDEPRIFVLAAERWPPGPRASAESLAQPAREIKAALLALGATAKGAAA